MKLRGRGADEISSVVGERGSPEEKVKGKGKGKMMERGYEDQGKQAVEEEKPVESEDAEEGGKRYLGYEIKGAFTSKEERE